MAAFTQHLRLLLIIAMVLSPVQPLFAMPTGQQADDSMAHHSMSAMATTAAVDDVVHSDASHMLDDGCNSKKGKCNHCQGLSQCGNCPLSLGIPQMTAERIELNAEIQLIISDVSFYSTDLLPDYRPPRYS